MRMFFSALLFKSVFPRQLFHILRKGSKNKYKDSLSKEKEYKQYVRVLSI